MRKEFGKVIVELADADDKIFLLVSDIGYGIFDKFKEKYPDRFLNLGICEQSIVGVASGMALMGQKPYVYTITPFLVERAFEQVKLDVNQQNVNVKLIGYADYPDQGPTHEDILVSDIFNRLFKNIKSYFPRSSEETRLALIESYLIGSPTFISLKTD